MFFKKGKNVPDKIISQTLPQDSFASEEKAEQTVEVPSNEAPQADAGYSALPYTFYKPDPYPKDLVSVLSKMLQRLFPDTQKAYLLEAHQNEKKGYLLVVDIDSKFLKIINIYLDSETKRVRGDIPIECVLYSKSGSITEGIDPFYFKETAQSKANNLASKEFSGDITFSQMPEFEIWSRTTKKDEPKLPPRDEKEADVPSEEAQDVFNEPVATKMEEIKQEVKEETIEQPEEVTKEAKEEAKEEVKEEVKEAAKEEVKEEIKEEKNPTKVKPSTKKELFGLLNEYGAKKSGTVSTVAMAAIKEYMFYIPYSYNKAEYSDTVDSSLVIDDSLRFKKLIDPETEKSAVPLFTEKEDAINFAKRDNCRIAFLKYKDFASSAASERTNHDGIVINPDDEGIFMLLTHPLLSE